MNKINLQCPIGYTGYGITSLNILKRLHQICNVSLFPIGAITEHHINDKEEIKILQSCINNAKFFDAEAPTLKIWHQNHLKERVGHSLYWSFPFFELDTLSRMDRDQINNCDGVFTATAWSKKVLENNGIKIPIEVCPLGVDRNIFKSDMQPNKTDDKFIFFHVGKWELRKSQDFLLKCFEKAFSSQDNVELWLSPHNPFLSEKELRYWVNMVKYHKLYEKIKIFPRFKTQYDLANMINMADCGVFISRAEGWNNEVLEAMSMNKPCIVTNYSAHTEYCNNKNSYLIEINETEQAFDNKWFFGQGNWAKLGTEQEENIIQTMRKVYNNRIRTNSFGVNTAIKYSWTNTSYSIYKNLCHQNY